MESGILEDGGEGDTEGCGGRLLVFTISAGSFKRATLAILPSSLTPSEQRAETTALSSCLSLPFSLMSLSYSLSDAIALDEKDSTNTRAVRAGAGIRRFC